jgi:2-deoxy-D-gluconate 3-dehydrogenase
MDARVEPARDKREVRRMATTTALVTGASAGLGRAIAVALAREGYDLALTDLSVETLKDTLAIPEIKGRKVIAVALDLRSQPSIKAAFERAAQELGAIDLLVNNAGRALPAADVTDAEWDDVIDTNLKGAFFLSQLFGRACIAAGRPGAIVSMASTHGMTGIAGRSVYGISKAGLIQMTRMLAIEWADKGIRVNAVAPTTVMTESRQQLLADPAKRAAALERIPSGRFATPEEVAAAVVYLASPGAASVTGHTLPVEAG